MQVSRNIRRRENDSKIKLKRERDARLYFGLRLDYSSYYDWPWITPKGHEQHEEMIRCKKYASCPGMFRNRDWPYDQMKGICLTKIAKADLETEIDEIFNPSPLPDSWYGENEVDIDDYERQLYEDLMNSCSEDW